MRFNPEQADKTFKALPEAIQNVIAAAETTRAIRTIGDKHHLHIDEMGKLGEAIRDVLFGLKPGKDFVAAVSANISKSKETINSIAAAAEELIFKPVRLELQKMTGEKEKMNGGFNDGAGLLDRQSLLQEIESPSPTPFSGRRRIEQIEGPEEKISLPEPEPPETPIEAASLNPPPAEKIEEQKEKMLPPTISLEAEEKNTPALAPQAPKNLSGEGKYIVDPYREPLK